MKVIDLQQNSEEWLEFRLGKITGSKLSGIVVKRGTNRKMGFYELIAERLGIPADEESAMDRGHRLEGEAIACFEKDTGLTVERVGMCVADFNESVALSPDGLISDSGKYCAGVEVKCLGSARHLQAIIENKVPDDYQFQILQYFIVCEEIDELFMVFYDPRLIARPYHHIRVKREDVLGDIDQYKEYQLNTLKEIDLIIEELEFN